MPSKKKCNYCDWLLLWLNVPHKHSQKSILWYFCSADEFVTFDVEHLIALIGLCAVWGCNEFSYILHRLHNIILQIMWRAQSMKINQIPSLRPAFRLLQLLRDISLLFQVCPFIILFFVVPAPNQYWSLSCVASLTPDYRSGPALLSQLCSHSHSRLTHARRQINSLLDLESKALSF